MDQTGLVAKCGLDRDDLVQVRALEEACLLADGVRVKFNWDMMEHRTPGTLTDFCYYQEGRLVGYIPLDDFGGAFEMTAAVLPAYRRQGIFTRLFRAASEEAQRREATTLLLVNYRASESGNATVTHVGIPYKFSEYHMVAYADAIPPLPSIQIELVPVTADNSDDRVSDLSRLLAVSFGATRWSVVEVLQEELQRPEVRYYLAHRDGHLIGQIGVLEQEECIYIRGVGILPEWRRQGNGRQLLSATVGKMLAEGHRRFELDVATENSGALSIYQSCGFQETTVYDYYTVPPSL